MNPYFFKTFENIGARVFEPPTPCSQGRCRLKQKEKRQGKGRKITVDSDYLT
jgi:hypothetical protein